MDERHHSEFYTGFGEHKTNVVPVGDAERIRRLVAYVQDLETRLDRVVAICRDPPVPSRMLIPIVLDAAYGTIQGVIPDE